ncbi:hypothetical protein SAY86_006429 [Trapa natans]|uniref:Uncharacterized protein n=1 Tax=Trapa natans TaxID=22666 RepID=A0AAN7L4J2_TRANT|nr:hypothetical protein SAY86_006429 [Trapa natans]
MGGRCQPLDFSGEICYNENGRKLDHLRLPRASHMQGYLAGPNSLDMLWELTRECLASLRVSSAKAQSH